MFPICDYFKEFMDCKIQVKMSKKGDNYRILLDKYGNIINSSYNLTEQHKFDIKEFYGLELQSVPRNNLCVIDIDDIKYLPDIEKFLDKKTLTVSTPSGGLHFWFHFPQTLKLPSIHSVFNSTPVELYSGNYANSQIPRTVDFLTSCHEYKGKQIIGIPPTDKYFIFCRNKIEQIPDSLLEFWFETYKKIVFKQSIDLLSSKTNFAGFNSNTIALPKI